MSKLSLKKKFVIEKVMRRISGLFINDYRYAQQRFKKWKGRELNLQNPQIFAEKLQYLKLFYRNPLMPICADKYYAREYVKACGYEYILKKIYGVYNNLQEVDFSTLPQDVFVHWNHMSGGNYKIVNGDVPKELYELLPVFKTINWYYAGREWQYKSIIPKLLCEEVLENKDGSPLVDYKFYCFGGQVKYYMISYGEYEHEHKNHKFDVNGNSIDYLFKEHSTVPAESIVKPDNISDMIAIAEDLSSPFPHVRIDLYNIDGRIVFGEMTFFSDSGFVNIFSEEMDKKIAGWIDLNRYKQDMVYDGRFKVL